MGDFSDDSHLHDNDNDMVLGETRHVFPRSDTRAGLPGLREPESRVSVLLY
jgi:hypothetical protein